MNRDRAFEIIRELVEKYVDVDCHYLTSTERGQLFEALDEVQYQEFSGSEE